ncbi:zinc ribbon domain-containing protein [Engelhardtia mirabilis]|uniref:Zinc ribbon domain protein n=1 Tax=Engelhardtia mirabilis TaxID=2528011 RepID=A0A518BJ73_9BACT|nr:Putative zinc ribbon domain protein [Planctomycetes bacterium Pla133]QDV01345.1 Putative zinc ribbon domain protein [Planctomycetes bacterium Pla86]
MRTLRDLQEIDEDLFRVKGELKRLPAERDKRRAVIDARLQRMKEIDADIFKLSLQVKEVEDMTKANRQRMMKLEREAGNTADQALLAAYSHEIRSLKRENAEADDEGLKLIERSDALQAERDAIQAQVDEEEAAFAVLAANVEAEIAVAEQKREGLDARRKVAMGDGVPPDVLTTYERMLEAREGMALAALESRVCQGCFMGVPANVAVKLTRGRELVQCPNCQRILYTWE